MFIYSIQNFFLYFCRFKSILRIRIEIVLTSNRANTIEPNSIEGKQNADAIVNNDRKVKKKIFVPAKYLYALNKLLLSQSYGYDTQINYLHKYEDFIQN